MAMPPLPAENLHLVHAALVDFPRPDALAETLLRPWLKARGIDTPAQEIDVVTLHYQLEPLGEGRQHFRENAVITQKMSAVQALLSNWQGESAEGYGGFHFGDWAGIAPSGVLHLVERLDTEGTSPGFSAYRVFNGLYRRQTPALYGPATRLPVRAEDFQALIWGLHLNTLYKAQLDSYWSAHLNDYQRALKINFIAACNRQVAEGSLSEEARQMIWQAAGISRQDRFTLKVSLLNVYGYVATSLLCLRTEDSALTLLYIPGNSSPFLSFDTPLAMKHWFARQCQSADRRAALLTLFSPLDWPDGLDFSGLQTALAGLGRYPQPHRFLSSHSGFATSGLWTPELMVDYRADHYNPPITEELFGYLARHQQQRAYATLDSQVVSNQQIEKLRATRYLNIALVMLAPVAMVIPALAPLLAAGGLAQFSLGLDRVLNGRSLEDKVAGVQDQVFGLFNALPLVGTAAARSSALYRWCRPGFVTFRQLLQGSDSAEALALQPAEAAFREPTVQASTQTAAVVTRIDESLRHRFAAWLQTEAGLENDWVCYELNTDSFIRLSQIRQESPPRWIVSAEHANALVPMTDSRTVSDLQRMATLRALGIHVDLPLDYTPYQNMSRTPLEPLITSVWLGDRRLGEPFIDAIAHNARALHGSRYEYQLLLSRQNVANFDHNVSQLNAVAPRLRIRTLEEQPFFLEFERSAYYPQYQAALRGDGLGATHFSSACDILRYRVLKHFGGLYMDTDDSLLLPKDGSVAALPLEQQDLRCSADGLLLAQPVSNDRLGMYIKFNSSLIGSHAGNPTLDAISDEILRRYRLEPTFYDHHPDPDLDPVGLHHYARRLNLLTGPGVLNDVIDQHLPWLRQLRETCTLLASPVHDVFSVVNSRALMDALASFAPLGDVADIGRAHSWLNH
ncbi:glycosyltransferase [Pseudomonas sp. RAC1]|uniref:dermonecrotic toxin domain-containing protein n=1 Tax=Pseudomonas sp. RAC1 TaxID=3064900 RepID=UPI002719670C|nr:DUF6543 domain-containing protein [Pseudomonas sp. RAC1]MDV9034110.1 glycosyltransferase [Pseudomonas sp. RAC1]